MNPNKIDNIDSHVLLTRSNIDNMLDNNILVQKIIIIEDAIKKIKTWEYQNKRNMIKTLMQKRLKILKIIL